jgi:hypothetical protein
MGGGKRCESSRVEEFNSSRVERQKRGGEEKKKT